MDGATANARRKYHHVHHGGKLTEHDIAGMVRGMENKDAEIARLTAERDAAIKALCEAAKAKGQAEGKLAASEMAGVVEGWKIRAEKAEAERDQALARAAASAMEMRERAAARCFEDQGRFDTPDRIRALPLDPDAQKALDQLLAKAREDAIRGAADVLTREYNICAIPINGVVINGSELTSAASCRDAILDLLNDGGGDE